MLETYKSARRCGRAVEPLVAGRELLKAFGPAQILEGANFLIQPGDKIALVGPNGSGKSTLFKLIAGETRPDLGELQTRTGLRIGYLPQVPNVPDDAPVRDILSAPSPEALALERELAVLEHWMQEPGAWDAPDAGERMARYGEMQAALGEARSRSTIDNDPILSDLGVPDEILASRFGDLSGGEKSKILLARALAGAERKDLLLLDEPTNHMDIPTIEWIEEFLLDLPTAVLLASHDKFLLDNVATKVLEVDRRRIYEYEGNYTSYRGQREAITRATEARKRKNFDEVKRQLAIIEDLRSRKRYTQIRSRKKDIERRESEQMDDAPSSARAFKLVFTPAHQSGRSVMRVEHVRKAFGDRLLFKDVSFEIDRGDKIGLIGPNGCGKTTLLEILTGRERPDSGNVEMSEKTRIGYFAQQHVTMDFDRTLYDELRSIRDPPPPEDWVRGLLGRFWFRGDDVFKKVGQLSGGERARLQLAKFIAEEHNLLVLDEPTNHLDIESQEIVAGALQAYPGSVLIVSHNRSFLNEIVNKVAVIAHREVGVFQGGFNDSWTAAKLGEFMAEKNRPKYRVLRIVRDWERGTSYQKGETIELTGIETQAFRRLMHWAEGEGRIERIQ
jgi:ATP-binding cassette, subfamily F, member 3